MKAALYQGVYNIEIADLPDYECGDDAIILKNIYSSICGTDVAVYHHGLGMVHIPLERNSQSAIAVRLSAPNGKVCSN